LVKGLTWTFDTLKAGDPDAYVMALIAWSAMYDQLSPLYDVMIANEYPTHTGDAVLKGALYGVVIDAGKAGDAIRTKRRHSFIYMPGIFTNLGGSWRTASLRELRYTFFAPLTQGAMGIDAWRLSRCSLPYRRAVVYPVMRQLKGLIPWLLGKWCDERVTSNHDRATVDYLQKIPIRIRTVADEKMVETPGIPDCSYMLRLRPSNSYLLLAVNNRKEPIDVTFTLTGIEGLPAQAHEYFDYYSLPIEQNQIKDVLEPFGVRAYIIDPL
jgi:hypothetical protein